MGNSNRGGLKKSDIQRLQKQVKMPLNEIENFHREFKQNSFNGRFINKAKFHEVYNELFTGDARDFADNVFRTFDRDKNGFVDFEEFIIGVYVSAGTDVEQKLRWAFKMYDIDGNGVIDKDELSAIIKAVYRAVGTDVDYPPEVLADKLFKEMDADGNGEISWEEFRDAAMKDDKVLKLLRP
ncbi:hypothetical protein ACF0H5_022937 [Mactra antiquata]